MKAHTIDCRLGVSARIPKGSDDLNDRSRDHRGRVRAALTFRLGRETYHEKLAGASRGDALVSASRTPRARSQRATASMCCKRRHASEPDVDDP